MVTTEVSLPRRNMTWFEEGSGDPDLKANTRLLSLVVPWLPFASVMGCPKLVTSESISLPPEPPAPKRDGMATLRCAVPTVATPYARNCHLLNAEVWVDPKTDAIYYPGRSCSICLQITRR